MSTSLAAIREQLDDVDQRIIDALTARRALVQKAADHKTEDYVRDAEREEAILDRLGRQAEDAGLNPDLITSLYRTIFDHSVRLQEDLIEQRSATNSKHEPAPSASSRNGSAPPRNGSAVPSSSATGRPVQPTPPPSSDDAPYPRVARSPQQADTAFHVGEVEIGGADPVLIGGPCSVESRDQIMACAEVVKEAGGHILRGGCFKPRTSPYSFQGLGFEGLDLLADAGRRFELPIITEVMQPDHVERIAEQSDILQIGARNMQNFALLKAVGGSHRPVMLKRGMMATVDDWLSAAEYILAHGNERVMLCQRGIRTFEPATRFTLDLTALPVVRERTHLPVIVDPSHACGTRRWVTPLAHGALAAGAQGLMVETHPCPDEARSDGPQSLTFEGFRQLAAPVRTAVPAGL